MRCKTCDYPLWQIKDRQCPECGTAFKPSEFEFNLNSVRFHCPHCDQVYYGTGPQGQLVPKSFACITCHTPVDMDDMILRPADNVTENQTVPPSVPWIDPRPRNPFARFFGTMGMAIGNPNRLIDGVPESSSPWRAFGYAAIQVIWQVIFSFNWWILSMFLFIGMTATGTSMGWGVAGTAAGTIIAAPIVLLLWTSVAHLVLKMTGPTAAGIGRTMHATCYSAGNNFLAGIPCLGFYLGWAGALWWTITAGFMLARAQKVSGLRAAFAVGTPLVLAGALFVGGFALMIFGVQGRVAGTIATAGTSVNSTNVSQMSSLLASSLPVPHVAELVAANRMTWFETFDATDMYSFQRQTSLVIGGHKMSDWINLSRPQAMAAAKAAAATLPPNTVAYRVADTVFTYPGIVPSNIPQGDSANQLWTLVLWPESLSKNGSPSRTIDIGLADGSSAVTSLQSFDAQLVQQNALRASVGLPALSHPADVTSAAPQTAPQPPAMTIPPGGTQPPPAAKPAVPEPSADETDPDGGTDPEP